jgi:hypothetical protein
VGVTVDEAGETRLGRQIDVDIGFTVRPSACDPQNTVSLGDNGCVAEHSAANGIE